MLLFTYTHVGPFESGPAHINETHTRAHTHTHTHTHTQRGKQGSLPALGLARMSKMC